MNIINQYFETINNASPEEQIDYLQYEIRDMKEFQMMYEEHLDKFPNDQETINNLAFCKEETIRLKQLIEDVKNGNPLVVNVVNYETNL